MSQPKPGSSEPPDAATCFAAVAELLDRLEAPWALAGAFAALAYRADERPTTDVDFLVQDDGRLVPGLIELGFDVRVFEDDGEPYLIRARRTGCVVDVMFPVTDYQRLALERAVDHILTVEDVIVHKLIAWRARDRDDIRSILATGAALDVDYIDRWSQAWGVESHWTAARQ